MINIYHMIRVFIYLFLPLTIYANGDDPRLSYIDRYKQLAKEEMQRTGIPASIKLAQGLLESGAGKSVLAKHANNHFGIKCGGSWEGETYYREDDDRNKKGELIPSCFRKFSSVYQSYFAHSEFLSTQRRYASLFDLDNTDYTAWARGLRKAGYATDKRYADKLIEIIEKYELHLFDTAEPLLASTRTTKTRKKDTPEKTPSAQPIPEPELIANASHKRSKKERTSKRSEYYTSTKESHRVRVGETIESIAREYGLDATKLRIRNRLPKDAVVLSGEKIHLRKKISVFKRPEFTREETVSRRKSEDEFIF